MSIGVSSEVGEAPWELRAQATGWQLLASLFLEPPGDARIEQARAFLSALGVDVGTEDGSQIRTDSLRLFVGLRKTLAPPWESVYLSRDRRVMQAAAVAVRRAYLAASLYHEGMFQTPDDHIGLELEFLASLAERTAQALEDRQPDAAEEALAAGERFWEEHLGRWVGDFGADIQAHAETQFWRSVGSVLGALGASGLPSPFAQATGDEVGPQEQV